MESLIKRIKQRVSGRGASRESSRVVAAAFGKHPGWDDHMDDIGLETPALVAIKRVLYVQGIGKNIDNGKWAELESKQSDTDFGHTFVWCRDDDIIAGRLWPSRDGRGRTSYPMVVCVHCRQVPLRWVYDCVLPHLACLETECQDGTASTVRACLSTCREGLQKILDTSDGSEQELPGKADLIGRLTHLPGLGPDNEGLIRILYHIDREMSVGLVSSVGRGGYEHAAHARVPASSSDVAGPPILWTRLLLNEYGRQAGVLIVMPHQGSWLDIIVGEPCPEQLYCLRASTDALPLTNTVPYKIDREFADKVRQQAGISEARGSI